jgi:phage terminase small subunit
MTTTQTLTPKQEAFCLAYLETGNGSEAYRQSYNAERMKAETIWVKACQLLKKDKVAVRLDELRKPAVEAAQVTLAGHLNDLERLRDVAEKAGNIAAAVSAEVARGKVAGLYVEKTEAVVQNFVVRTPLKSKDVDEWTAEHSPTVQ